MLSRKSLRSWSAWRLPLSALLFLIIPVLFLIAVFELTKAKGPQWLPDTFENPYAYLFNSLLLVKGQSPVYIDHPGTTTEVFGAIVLRASSAQSADDLVGSTLRDPEKQIRKLHRMLLFFAVAALWLGPWMMALALRNFVVGLLLQAPSLFYQTLLYYGFFFGSDLMLVPFSMMAICCCSLLMVPRQFSENLELPFLIDDRVMTRPLKVTVGVPVLPVLSGLACALGLATKLTFFPLILISLFCCRTRRNLATFIAAFVIAFAGILLPIYSQLPRLLTWAIKLSTHSGDYGSGAVGFAQPDVYFSFLKEVLQKEPLLAIIPLVTIAVVMLLSLSSRKDRSTKPVSWRTALALFVIQLISFLVIVKESGYHYFIPLFLSTGLNLVLAFYAFQSSSSSRIGRIAAAVALASLLLLGFANFIEKTTATYVGLCKDRQDQLRLYMHATEVKKDGVRVDYLFSDSKEYAACYGNSHAGRFFGHLLTTIYPEALFFNVVDSRFETFTGELQPEDVLSEYDHLYFLGTPSLLPKTKGLDPQTFETIDHAGDYYLQKWTRK